MTTRRYKTREPEVKAREPVAIAERVTERLPHMPHTIGVHIPLMRCSVCGCGTMRKGGGTRPDLSTGKMARRWQCAHCGQRYCVFMDPTEAEIAKYFDENAID